MKITPDILKSILELKKLGIHTEIDCMNYILKNKRVPVNNIIQVVEVLNAKDTTNNSRLL